MPSTYTSDQRAQRRTRRAVVSTKVRFHESVQFRDSLPRSRLKATDAGFTPTARNGQSEPYVRRSRYNVVDPACHVMQGQSYEGAARALHLAASLAYELVVADQLWLHRNPQEHSKL